MKTHLLGTFALAATVALFGGCAQWEPAPPGPSPTTSPTPDSSPEAMPTPSATPAPPSELTPEQAFTLCIEAAMAKDIDEGADPDEVRASDYDPFDPSGGQVTRLDDDTLRVAVGVGAASVTFCDVTDDPAAPLVSNVGTVDAS